MKGQPGFALGRLDPAGLNTSSAHQSSAWDPQQQTGTSSIGFCNSFKGLQQTQSYNLLGQGHSQAAAQSGGGTSQGQTTQEATDATLREASQVEPREIEPKGVTSAPAKKSSTVQIPMDGVAQGSAGNWATTAEPFPSPLLVEAETNNRTAYRRNSLTVVGHPLIPPPDVSMPRAPATSLQELETAAPVLEAYPLSSQTQPGPARIQTKSITDARKPQLTNPEIGEDKEGKGAEALQNMDKQAQTSGSKGLLATPSEDASGRDTA